MTNSERLTANSRRKIAWLIGVVVLLFALLTAGWYWAAGRLDETVRNARTNLAAAGKALECSDQSVAGYPFRIGLRCDSLSYDDPQAGITINGGSLRSAAQLYRPGHVVAEMDAPVDLRLPGLAPLTLEWENLQTSGRVNTSGPQRFSLVATKLDVSANDFGIRDLLASVSELQLHARAAETTPGALDLALSAEDWLIDDNGAGQIKPIRLNFIGMMEEAHAVLTSGADLLSFIRANGGRGQVLDLTLATNDGGRLSMRGPLTVDRSGLLSGDIKIDIDDPGKLIDYVSIVFPPAGPMLENTAGFLDGFAKQENGKAVIRDLPLAIENGKVFAGFFQIGEIPRLLP